METITFNTQVRGGMIEVPEKYKNLETESIEVILILKNHSPQKPGNHPKGKKSLRGILGKYKNPALIPEEGSACQTEGGIPGEF